MTKLDEGAISDEAAEKFCALVNWHPDGSENKFVEGVLVTTTFRELAKGYLRAAIAALPSQADMREKAALPSIEAVAEEVHSAWMDAKRAGGVHSRLSESGEELIAPYAQLSEEAKELDRATVRAVYRAIRNLPIPSGAGDG